MSAPELPRPRSRWTSAHSGGADLLWMYLLIGVPMLTDVIETGRLPASVREWVTEVVAGAVIAALVHKVRAAHKAALALSRIDVLTGLWNRRAFDEAIEDDCVRARRSGQPLSLVYIDLDNFKQVNDRDGHQAGDRVLQEMAAAVGDVIRARVDRGFRLGGDEFAILLPGSRAGQAEAVVNRISEHCARASPLWGGGHLGISAGVVELGRREHAIEFVKRADETMYTIKHAGAERRVRA
jgi:diguanylate cyclase (GGDEF)-like protein